MLTANLRRALILGLTIPILAAACGTSSSVSASAFQGTWHLHTDYLVIHANGTGTATWPIHVFCGTGVGMGGSPCDKLASNGQITDGGHADLTIESVSGDTASGKVTSSTVQSTLPNGPIRLRVDQMNDVLYLTPSRPTTASPYGSVPLCGPRAYAKSQQEGSAAEFNCGA